MENENKEKKIVVDVIECKWVNYKPPTIEEILERPTLINNLTGLPTPGKGVKTICDFYVPQEVRERFQLPDSPEEFYRKMNKRIEEGVKVKLEQTNGLLNKIREMVGGNELEKIYNKIISINPDHIITHEYNDEELGIKIVYVTFLPKGIGSFVYKTRFEACEGGVIKQRVVVEGDKDSVAFALQRLGIVPVTLRIKNENLFKEDKDFE